MSVLLVLDPFELVVACCCGGWLDVDGPNEAGMVTVRSMARAREVEASGGFGRVRGANLAHCAHPTSP